MKSFPFPLSFSQSKSKNEDEDVGRGTRMILKIRPFFPPAAFADSGPAAASG
jgi:hypothetical protein